MSETIMVKGVSFTKKDILHLNNIILDLEAQRDFLKQELMNLRKIGDCDEQ